MDLDKVRNKLAEIDEEQQAAAAEKERQQTEASRPWYEKAWDTASGVAERAANLFVTTPSKLQTMGEEAYTVGSDIYQAAQNAPDAFARLWSAQGDLSRAYSPEAVKEANSTGDYSAQQEAVRNMQQAGREFVWDTAGTATESIRGAIGHSIYENAENGSEIAQNLRDSSTYMDYFMTPEDKVAKANEIENNLGISANAILGDDEAYKRALRMNDYYKKVKDILPEGQFSAMDQVWKEYPELNDLNNMNPQEQALALHNMEAVRSTHGIIETFTKMLETGNKRLELSNLGYKLAMGQADDNDRERIKELQKEVEYESSQMPSFWDNPVAAIAGGLAMSAPELWQSTTEGMRDAAIYASAAMVAGAAAGSAATPVGTVVGGTVGAAGGAATGFGRSLFASFGRRAVARAALDAEIRSSLYSGAGAAGRSLLLASGDRAVMQAALGAGMRYGMYEGMARPEAGERYLEYRDMKDVNGNRLLTDEQARGWAMLAGSANAAIEMADFGAVTKALSGAPHAAKVFGDIIEGTGARLTAREAAKDLAYNRLTDAAKITLAESGEEALQSASDDLVHNAIESSTGDTSNGVYSSKDILGRAALSFAETLPVSFGFGLAGGVGGSVTGTMRVTRAMRQRAKLDARYGTNANQTVTGTIMLEQLQQAVASGKLKEKPELQSKVLRNQLAGTEYQMAYIDTEMALQKDTGAEDLKKVAKVAGITDDELNTAVKTKGQIAVPVEKLSQVSTPNMLDAVSFSPEADSIARMRQDAQSILDEAKKRSEQSLNQLLKQMDSLIDEYYPEYDEKGENNAIKRDLMRSSMCTNITNPSMGWTLLHKELRSELDEMIAPALARLQEGMGKGGQIIETEDEQGNKTYKRFTENDVWYQNFYKAYGRRPTKAELEDMAIAMLSGDSSAPQIEGWIPTTPEEEKAMQETGAWAKELQQELAAMDEIRPVMRRLNGVEMTLTKNLTPEGLRVYRTIADQLTRYAPARAARAARMDAILFARHADIYADIMSRKTGKKYTALDYMRERYGFDVTGKGVGGSLSQAAITNPGLNLDSQVEIYNIEPQFEGADYKELRKKNGPLKAYKEHIQWKGAKTTLDGIKVYASGRTYSHVLNTEHGGDVDLRRTTMHFEVAVHLDDIVEHSFLVEGHADEHENEHVDATLRLFAPVRIGDDIWTVKLTVKRYKDGVCLAAENGNLAYDMSLIDKKEGVSEDTPSARDESFRSQEAAGQQIPLEGRDHLSTLSIRDVLRGVKDNDGVDYINEDGTGNFRLATNTLAQAGQPERNLIAYHNMRPDAVLQAAQAGGIPVPSIAVTRKDIPFDNFGGITLIGNVSLVDPERGNDVYSRDAYTVRTPAPEYRGADGKTVKAFAKEWMEKLKDIPGGREAVSNLTDTDAYRPEEGGRQARNQWQVMYYYLTHELGKKVELVMERPPYENEFLNQESIASQLADILGSDASKAEKRARLYEVIAPFARTRMEDIEARNARRRAKIAGGVSQERQEKLENATELDNARKAEYQAIVDGDGKVSEAVYEDLQRDYDRVAKAQAESSEVDVYASKAKMRREYRQELNDGFEEYTENMMAPLRGEPVVKVGRKYEPYTIGNIVKAMLKNRGQGQEDTLGFSTSKAAAVASKKFRSLEDLRKRQDSLAPDDEVQAAVQEVNDALHAAFLRVSDSNKYVDDFSKEDFYNEAVANAVKGGKKATAANVKRELDKAGFDTAAIAAEDIQAVVEAANKLREAASWYYEAKPQRAVGLDEFSGAVVPEDTAPEVRQALEEAGLRVETYPEGDTAARMAAIEKFQSVPEVLFQNGYVAPIEIDTATQEYLDRKNNTMAQETHGETTRLSNGQRIVTLFESADESTFAHEMAHMFLYDLEDLARIDDTSAMELDVVNEWATYDPKQLAEYKKSPWWEEFRGYALDIEAAEQAGDIDTADHLKAVWRQERFARGFESYLSSGEAPAKGLKAVFRKFKSFLRSIYEAFIGDGGKPSLSVKRVMDRMVATEDEIKELELDDRYKDIEKAGGEKLLDEKEEDTYKRWQEEANQEAEERLMAIVMKDLTEKKQKEFERDIQDYTEAMRKQLQQEPVYLAERAIQASGGDESLALNWFESVEQYKEARAQAGPLETQLQAMVDDYTAAKDEELRESHITEEEVMKAMDGSEYRKKLEAMKATALAKKVALVNTVTEKTRRAMRSVEEKIKELPDDADIQDDRLEPHVKTVMDAINRLRFSAKWTAADYKHIERLVRAKSKAEIAEALKDLKAEVRDAKSREKAVIDANEGKMHVYADIAHANILQLPLAEAMNTEEYIRRTKKSAKNVQKLLHAGRYDVALIEQRNAALAAAMAHESAKLREQVQKDMKKIMQHLNARTVHLPKDEYYWLHHLAYILRIVPKDVEQPASGVASLNEVFQVLTDSLDIQFTPVDILELATRGEEFRGWQSLNIGQWQDALEALTILYTTGRDKFAMKTIGGKDIADVVQELIEDPTAYQIRTNLKRVNEDKGGLAYNDLLAKGGRLGETLAEKGQEYMAVSLKPEELLWTLGRKAHDYIYGIYEKAQMGESKRIAQEMETLKEMLKPFSHKEKREWKTRKWVLQTADGPEKMSKENIICMALNLGNDTNYQRLAGGLGIDSPAALQKFIESHMTRKDWTLVQNIWDHLNSYWAETVKVEEQLNGVALQKVEARAFDVVLPDGETMHMRGGYYPIVYNPVKSSRAAENEQNALARQGMSGAQVLGTGRGFTKSRSEADIERPLLLEFRVIPKHIQQVIHNIYFRIPARDVYRLVNSQALEQHIAETVGRPYHKLLKEWATDVWGQVNNNNNQADALTDRLLAGLRRNSVMAIMGYRLWPVIENVSNIGPVMDKLGATNALGAISDFYAHFDESRDLLYKSIFMRNRINSMDRDIGSQEGLFAADARPFEIIRGHAYDMMLYSDLMLSAPLWVQAYKDAYAEKLAEVKKENDANAKEMVEAKQELDEVNGRVYDLQQNIGHIDDEFRRRARREAAAEESPFTVRTRDELYQEKQENKAELKELREARFAAEKRAAKADRIELLSDDQVLAEAERRAIAAADAAVKDTFGSGFTMDLSSVQRNKNQMTKLLTTFYSFFNTQFNALYAAYNRARFSPEHGSGIRRWAPVARSVMYRLVLVSLIGSALKYVLAQDGDSDDQKYRKVKNADGKTVKEERSTLERFLNVFGKNLLSTTAGGFFGVRDAANLLANFVFDDTTYGRGFNPFSTAFHSTEEGVKTFQLLANKGKRDLEIEEKHAKKEQEQRQRLAKLKGKERQEYLAKLEEDKKYEKPDKHITYAEIVRHGANAISTLTAANTGLTNTLVDAVTGAMQYMFDDDNRYDNTWTKVIWSALFDKKPVEREIPDRPPAPPKEKNNRRKRK